MQVELARPVDGQRFVIGFAAMFGNRDGRDPREKLTRQRAFRLRHLGGRASGDDLSAVLACARSHVDQIIGGFDQVEVVLHHQHGVAQIAQAAQDVDEAVRVAGVQTNRRLVEDVKHARQTRPEQGSQPQALGFARGEGRRGAFERLR